MTKHWRTISAAAVLALGLGGLAGQLVLAAPAGATTTLVCRTVVFGGSNETVCVEQAISPVASKPGGVVGVATGVAAHLDNAVVTLSSSAGTVASPMIRFWSGEPPLVTPAVAAAGPYCASLYGSMTPSGPSTLVAKACTQSPPRAS